MHWTRRQFLQISGGVCLLGLSGIVTHAKAQDLRAYFNDWRALPGMKMVLTLNMAEPESAVVLIVARVEGHERVIQRLQGASQVEVEMPYIETKEESFEVCAIVEDRNHGRYLSDSVEVLAQSYQFGL